MEEIDFDQLYNIDKNRLLKYYERIKNQFPDLDALKIIAKFLNNQSIGDSINDVYNILDYYKNKIKKNILDFAFEWIRAQKIRLEYKKYLIRAQYNNFQLAVDDCISLFFLEYDKYLRNILKDEIKEYEISSLYEIFFVPFQVSNINVVNILNRYRNKVPTIFIEDKRFKTNLITLRSSLREIVKHDFDGVMLSRKEEKQKKELPTTDYYTPKKKELIFEFNGTLLERMIKTYCFNKKEISRSEIENGIAHFLGSYFRFGKFYEYEEFKDVMINSLADFINSGLTDRYKKSDSLDFLIKLISNVLMEFRTIHKIQKLDGVAWINDLKPVLKSFVTKFIDNLK